MRFKARSFCLAVVLAPVLAACQDGATAGGPPPLSDVEAVEPAPERRDAAPSMLDWARGDCIAKLRLLQRAAAAGELDPEAPPPFLVTSPLLGSPRDWLKPELLPLARDLPLAVAAEGSHGAHDPDCVIELGRPQDQHGEQRVVATETVRSSYQTGTRSERNPEYEVAQARVRQAEREARRREQGLVRVGDPMIDLVGTMVESLIQGFKEEGGARELDAALAELAATPRSLDQPVYRPYHFERTIVHGRKTALIPVMLRDRGGRALQAALLRQREVREHHVLDGLDPRDRDYEQHRAQGISRRELARWLETPPELRLSDVVAGLLAGERAALETLPDGSPGTALAGQEVGRHRAALAGEHPQPRPPPLPAPDLASLVRIGHGTGVYVAPRLVLTALRLVDDALVVDVGFADGQTVPGMVAHADPMVGLAVVQVPRPGAPLGLGQAREDRQEAVRFDGRTFALSGGREGPAAPEAYVGSPVLARDGLIGLIAGADGRSLVHAPAIERVLDRAGQAVGAGAGWVGLSPGSMRQPPAPASPPPPERRR